MTGPAFDSDACRALDARAMGEAGIPGILLMEHASIGASLFLKELLGDAPDGRHVWIVCGPGNNGGDGYAIARHLANCGVTVTVWDLVNPASLRKGSDPAINRAVLPGFGVEPVPAWDSLPPTPEGTDIAVDAIFGTGLARPPEGRFAEAMHAMQDCGAPVFAVDVPSGISADTGHALGPDAIQARWTATFGLPKRGHALVSGPWGEVRLVPIGAPRQYLPPGVPAFPPSPSRIQETRGQQDGND